MRALWLIVTAIGCLLILNGQALAEKAVELDGYVIHYNALSTDFLSPEVAKLYGISRSKNRGMLNITVLKKHMGLASLPVPAIVTASAVNLSNQTKALAPREVTDGGAIYYIAEFPVSDKEMLEFNISVRPEGGKTHDLSFTQQFHTN
jgi:hypothetical protein